HVALVGRHGFPGPAEEARAAKIRESGTRVTVHACDVSDARQVDALFAELSRHGTVRGVFHAAMVLDDAPIALLDAERFRVVTGPKAVGAWNLHCATDGLPLEHFVLFSSIASVIGTPGQGNYAAANGFL